MCKFKIGDIIVANATSNGRYNITTRLNGFVGLVTSAYEDGSFCAKTLESKKQGQYGVGWEWGCLEDAYFDIAPDQIQAKYGRIVEPAGNIDDSDFSKLF